MAVDSEWRADVYRIAMNITAGIPCMASNDVDALVLQIEGQTG